VSDILLNLFNGTSCIGSFHTCAKDISRVNFLISPEVPLTGGTDGVVRGDPSRVRRCLIQAKPLLGKPLLELPAFFRVLIE
jgi:hypothetical protein